MAYRNRRNPFREPWSTSVMVTWTTTGPGSAVTTVAFPAGRFSSPPAVQVTKRAGAAAKSIPYMNPVPSTTSVGIGLYTGDGSSITAGTSVAVQVTAFDTAP